MYPDTKFVEGIEELSVCMGQVIFDAIWASKTVENIKVLRFRTLMGAQPPPPLHSHLTAERKVPQDIALKPAK